MAKKTKGRRRTDAEGTKLTEAVAEAHALEDQLDHAWYGYGGVIRRIATEKLFKLGGYKNVAACWKAELGLEKNEATKYVNIVSAFTEPNVVGFHPNHLAELIIIAALMHATLPDNPGKFDIPVPNGKETTPKPFGECSLGELKAAVKALKKPHEVDGTMPAADAAQLKGWQANLYDYAGDQTTHITGVFRNGQSRVSLTNVLLSDFEGICEQFGGALNKHPRPTPHRGRVKPSRRKPARR